MPLSHDVHELLLLLEVAQGGNHEWVHIDALRHLSEKEIERAVRENWIKQKGFGNLREFKILAAGYSALGDNAEFTIKQMRGENVQVLDAPVEGVKTCCEPGCDQPRHLTYNRCKAHQQAVWRERETRQRNAVKPNRPRRSAPATQPHVAIVEPSIADEDTRPDIQPVVDTPPVLTRLFARAAVKAILVVRNHAKGGY